MGSKWKTTTLLLLLDSPLKKNLSLQTKRIIEGKIEGRTEATGRRRRIPKQLLDELKETRGCRQFKEAAQDRTMWRTRFALEKALDLS
jgi:hypothetical protein